MTEEGKQRLDACIKTQSKKLDLSNCEVSSNDLQLLKNLDFLEEINLSNNEIEDLSALLPFLEQGMDIFRDTNQLKGVNISKNPVNQILLRAIKRGRQSVINYYKGFKDIHENLYNHLIKKEGLKFTLNNNKRKLKDGYWFKTYREVLYFSLWKETSTEGLPNIFFAIEKSGYCSLRFFTDQAEKKMFLVELAEVLDMSLVNDTIPFWIKHYKGANYLDSVDTFLKRDKKIIDTFITVNGKQAAFPLIGEQEFLTSKELIEKERQDFEILAVFDDKDIKAHIILKSLTFKNLSLFDKEHTIQFHHNLTCFIGLNGTGKTSILRAIALAFTGFEQDDLINADERLLLIKNLQNLLHIKGIKNETRDYPSEGGYIELDYQVGEDDAIYQNRILLTLENEEPKISNDSNSEFRNYNDSFFRSLFLAFPQVQGGNKPRNIPNTPNIHDVLPLLTNEPDSRFEAFGRWLRGLNAKANEKKAQGRLSIPERKGQSESNAQINEKKAQGQMNPHESNRIKLLNLFKELDELTKQGYVSTSDSKDIENWLLSEFKKRSDDEFSDLLSTSQNALNEEKKKQRQVIENKGQGERNTKANERKVQGQVNLPESKLLEMIFKIISDVVGETIKIHKIVVVNKTDDIIWVKLGENSKPIIFELISQGYNNVFGWIGYFMKRLVESTIKDPDDIAEDIDLSQLPAIVLIDEIDTYLHPKWQAKILAVLVETFKNVQFIVTTHSPLVVANIKNGILYNVENEKIMQVPYGFYGKDYSFTLENQMNTPSRNPNVQKELDNLFTLIEAEDFEKAEKELVILQEKYPNEPELTRAQTTITLLKD